jgi:pimeloyl-ACP methyl ester carboxylesterase
LTTIQKSATWPNVAVETKRAGPAYHETLVRSGYAPVNGIQMCYEIHGKVAARPLVTIHPRTGLANVFPSLIGNRQLIAVELQGCGRTVDIDHPMTPEQHADDIAALLKYLGIRQADFFGESLRGTVAMLMALRHPGMVRRVASFGSILGKFDESVAPEDLAQLFMKSSRAVWNGFSHDQLKSIKAPVLIAAGDRDFVSARFEHYVEVSRLIPNAQLAVIPDAGHFVLYEDPDKLLPIVANFLDHTSTVSFATTISGYHPGETR